MHKARSTETLLISSTDGSREQLKPLTEKLPILILYPTSYCETNLPNVVLDIFSSQLNVFHEFYMARKWYAVALLLPKSHGAWRPSYRGAWKQPGGAGDSREGYATWFTINLKRNRP